MDYTPEQLDDWAVATERMHGETLTVEWRLKMADQLRAHAAKIEECGRAKTQITIAIVAFDAIASGIPNPREYAEKCSAALKGEPR